MTMTENFLVHYRRMDKRKGWYSVLRFSESWEPVWVRIETGSRTVIRRVLYLSGRVTGLRMCYEGEDFRDRRVRVG